MIHEFWANELNRNFYWKKKELHCALRLSCACCMVTKLKSKREEFKFFSFGKPSGRKKLEEDRPHDSNFALNRSREYSEVDYYFCILYI